MLQKEKDETLQWRWVCKLEQNQYHKEVLCSNIIVRFDFLKYLIIHTSYLTFESDIWSVFHEFKKGILGATTLWYELGKYSWDYEISTQPTSGTNLDDEISTQPTCGTNLEDEISTQPTCGTNLEDEILAQPTSVANLEVEIVAQPLSGINLED